jgi:hypothetical protein
MQCWAWQNYSTMPNRKKNSDFTNYTHTMINAWSYFNVIFKGKKPMQWLKSPLAVQRSRVWTFSFTNEMDEIKLSLCNFLKLVAQEQLPQKNHVPWGVKGISFLGRKGLSYLKGVTMFPWGVKSLSCLGEQPCS